MLATPRLVGYLIFTAVVLTASLAAQSPSSNGAATPSRATACDSLDPKLPHAEALRTVCQYAETIPQRMPNFTCQQQTSRLVTGAHDFFDTITGVITYEDGKESYKDVRRNGQPVNAGAPLEGAWSAGQFGSDLQSIFDARNKAEFSFGGEKKINGHQAWQFGYRIAHQDVQLWRLHVETQTVAPPYHGKLWIDQATGSIVRLQVEAGRMPASFPMRQAELNIDYENVQFSDGTRFVLPVKSELNSLESDKTSVRNLQTFEHCRKFAATTRIVPQ